MIIFNLFCFFIDSNAFFRRGECTTKKKSESDDNVALNCQIFFKLETLERSAPGLFYFVFCVPHDTNCGIIPARCAKKASASCFLDVQKKKWGTSLNHFVLFLFVLSFLFFVVALPARLTESTINHTRRFDDEDDECYNMYIMYR